MIDPIHVVDVYQVLAHVLHVAPRPHNGTWEHVAPALLDAQPAGPAAPAVDAESQG